MSNTGTDGQTIETSCLWNQKGSGQVQMIWLIQEWSLLRQQHYTTSTPWPSYLQGPDPAQRLLAGADAATITWQLPAKPVDMNYTWPCDVMCTPVDLIHPQRSVQHAADVASPAQKVEHDTRPTPIWLLWGRKSGREEKPNPGLVFSLQHEHVILVFSSHLLNQSMHSQRCLFSIQRHVVLHFNRLNYAATNLHNQLLKY